MTVSSNPRSMNTFRAIYIGGGVRVRARASADILKTDWLRSLPSRVSAVFQSASQPLPAVGKMPAAIERTQPLVALAAGPLTRWGHIGVANLLRRLWAAGSPSFGSLVQDPQKSASIFDILLRPKPLSIRAAHAEQHAWSFLKCLTNALKGQSR